MTGGYFHKLLQFLELSCIALASLVTANGASVAGCGPREAAELLGAGEESCGVLEGLLVWECSWEQPPDPRKKGWPHPGCRVPDLEVLLASTLSQLSFFFSFYS